MKKRQKKKETDGIFMCEKQKPRWQKIATGVVCEMKQK